MQLTELRGFADRMGWTVIEYVEKASGKRGSKRPVLEQLLNDARLKKFAVVLVWKMDRFGRSLGDLIDNIQILDSVGIRFMAPSQSIDTDKKSPIGKLILHVMGAFAEFERDLIAERVRSGLDQYKVDYAAGKAQSNSGKNLALGRPKRIFRRDQVEKLRAKGLSWRAIAKQLKVPFSTVRGGVRKTPPREA